jgi:hypothetical protein
MYSTYFLIEKIFDSVSHDVVVRYAYYGPHDVNVVSYHDSNVVYDAYECHRATIHLTMFHCLVPQSLRRLDNTLLCCLCHCYDAFEEKKDGLIETYICWNLSEADGIYMNT